MVPQVSLDQGHRSGRRISFEIDHVLASAPTEGADGTVSKNGARCVACDGAADLSYIRAEGREGRLGSILMAVVAEGKRRREYLAPTAEHERAGEITRPNDVPEASLPAEALGFRVQGYGMSEWADLFTNRQLSALTCFSDLVSEARGRVIADGGSDEYANAVATYLGFGVSKATDYHNSLCTWRSDVKNEGIGHLFSRQVIPMAWDFCEANPLSSSSGNMRDQWVWVSKALECSFQTRPALSLRPMPPRANTALSRSRLTHHITTTLAIRTLLTSSMSGCVARFAQSILNFSRPCSSLKLRNSLRIPSDMGVRRVRRRFLRMGFSASSNVLERLRSQICP